MIESVLAARAPHLAVKSVGTAAPRGFVWDPRAITVLTESGYEVTAKPAIKIKATDVRAAELILTAEGRHRATVAGLDPTAESRCYTLLEAARLVGHAPTGASGPAGLAARLAVALHRQRTEHDDDLPDPIDKRLDDFRACLSRVEVALAKLVPALGT